MILLCSSMLSFQSLDFRCLGCRMPVSMYCQSTFLDVLAKLHQPLLSSVSNCAVKAPKFWGSLLPKYQHSEGVSRYVLSKYQHLLRESRNSGCQVFSNMLVKAPIVNFLRELHLFSVNLLVSSSLSSTTLQFHLRLYKC